MISRSWTAAGWLALPVVGGLALAAPDVAEAVRWVPFLLGLVVLALPHGAVDHHVPRRLGKRGGRTFIAGYGLAVLAGLVLWSVAPLATLAAFFVVAALHWGSGDGWYARHVHHRAPFTGWADAALFVAARGALPVALPALAHPAETARGTDAILRAVGAASAPVLGSSTRAAGLAVVGVLVVAAAVSGARASRGRGRAALIDVGELALLAVFFVVTPPVLAVGTYLLAWHAPRHVARLIASDATQAAMEQGRAFLAWSREAAPLTVVSLAGLAVLAATAWSVPVAADAVTGAALAVIAALTFPHAAVVSWMDREQAVFAGPARR